MRTAYPLGHLYAPNMLQIGFAEVGSITNRLINEFANILEANLDLILAGSTTLRVKPSSTNQVRIGHTIDFIAFKG